MTDASTQYGGDPDQYDPMVKQFVTQIVVGLGTHQTRSYVGGVIHGTRGGSDLKGILVPVSDHVSSFMKLHRSASLRGTKNRVLDRVQDRVRKNTDRHRSQ